MGVVDPMLVVRHLSMAFYLVFVAFSALTLRYLLPPGAPPYKAALALFAFWPIGVTMGARITCDIMLYAGEMGVFYYLVRWLREENPSLLAPVFFCAGISVLAKNSGIFFLAFSFLSLLHAAYLYRKNLQQLLTLRLFFSVFFALAAAYWTFSRASMFAYMPYADHRAYTWLDYLRIYGLFDPYEFLDASIINLQTREGQPLFWNWFMRSLLLGHFIEWKALSIVFAIGCAWLAMLLYLLVGVAVNLKMLLKKRPKVYLFLMFSGAVLIASLIAARIRVPNPAYADARYIYPILPIILIFYGKIMQKWEDCGKEAGWRVGNGLALSMVLLSMALFAAQHVLLSKIQ